MSVKNYDFAPSARLLNPVSDMYAHVLYEASLYPWSMRMEDDDYAFTKSGSSRSVDEQGRTTEEIRGLVPLNAFAIREAFDSLDPTNPSGVLQFLNAAGEFWYSGSVSLRQIMEWQRFEKLVRRQDFMYLVRGILSSDARDVDDSRDAKQAFEALHGRQNSFFVHSKPFTDWPPVHSDWPPEYQQSILSSYRESEEEARKQLRAHQMAFLRPQGDALQIEWQNADEHSRTKHLQILAEQQHEIHMGRSQQERDDYWARLQGNELKKREAVMATAPPEMARGTFNLKPAIVIRARDALEAIAAANYIDLIRGVDWKRCELKTCNQIFEVKSNHGQQYCAPPRSCKNIAVMRQRRSDPKIAAREKAAAQKRARRKKDNPTKGIEHRKTQSKRGSK